MRKASLVILGCPKNIVEGEYLAGILGSQGCSFTGNIKSAEAAVVHTCAFVNDARDESEKWIKDLSKLRKSGKLKNLIVTGCLAEALGPGAAEKYPFVDKFYGTGHLSKVSFGKENGQKVFCGKPGGLVEPVCSRVLTSPIPSAYLRIAEGCDHKCSFCVIPQLRGKYKSRPMGNILREAAGLAKSGIKEIILIAQDTTSYGKDIYGSFTLAKLIRKLAKISGIEWIRIMYAYPGSVTDELLDLFAAEPKLCSYIDIPLQHVSKSVLKRMKRPLEAREIVERIIKKAPGVVIRTSLIVGFPRETEREFSELKKFVSEGLIEHLGVFSYSDVEGTNSLKMAGKVPDGLKEKRKDILMKIQQKVIQKKNEGRIGSFERVFVEKFSDGKVYCRSRFQAPEIDSSVIEKGVKPDTAFINVKITGVKGYDLIADRVL